MSVADIGIRAKQGAKILTFDIETSPHTVHTWGLWDQNVSINQIIEPGRVICWAAKWYGRKAVEFRSDHHDGHDAMIQRMWELLNEAEITVGFNHKKFDLRHLQREFWLQGLSLPSPSKQVDLLPAVKSLMLFPSNKLDYVSQQVGIGEKVKHEGFGLWTSCLAGDDAAWKRMRTYNVQDVRLTEALYDRMRGYIPNHPHHLTADATEDRPRCNECWMLKGKGYNLARNGTKLAQQITYVLYRCLDCGANVQGTRHSRAAVTRGAR